MAEKEVEVNGYRFAYRDQGDGQPLVFIHGSLLDYRYWANEIDHFSQYFRVIAPSRRHHWPNSKPKGEFTYLSGEHTKDMIEFVDKVAGEPVHLVGHSYAGYLAIEMASQRPGLCRSLVLMEPGGPIEPMPPFPAPGQTFAKAANLYLSGEIEKACALFMDTVCTSPKWKDCSKNFKQMTLDNVHTVVEQIKEIRPAIKSSQLRQIACPTLLLMGKNTPKPFPQIIEAAASSMPHAQIATIPQASHLMNQDNPVAYIRTLSEFVEAQD